MAEALTGRGFGFIDDVPDARDNNFPLERIIGDPRAQLPKLVELGNYVDYVRNQGQTSSCVGFGVTRAINMRARIQGVGSKYGSALYAYTGGRAAQYDFISKLRDEGSRPREVMKFVKDWGLASEDALPFDQAKVNEPLDWKALESGNNQLERLDHNILGYYWIDGEGEDKILGFKRALASGYPVCFAVDVDVDFAQWNDDKPIPDLAEDADILGGHYIVAIGYTPEDNILAVNSWGPSWGDFGFCEISKARIMNESTRAACAIEVAPAIDGD